MRSLTSILLLIFPLILSGQIRQFSLGPWHHQSLHGELGVRGTYRGANSLVGDVSEIQNSYYATGGLRLNSNSYFWRPDILQLGLNGEFYPETRTENYITLPDRSEVRTLNKFGIDVSLLNNKPLTLISYMNYDNSYYRRENLTDVKSINRQWGGRLNFSNNFLPLSFSFRKTRWNQEELETERMYFRDQTNIEARASKSFGQNDKHALSIQYNDYYYQQAGIYDVRNQLNRALLENSVYFDKNKNYNLNTRFSMNDQTGYYAFRRFDGSARLDFILPDNFRFRANADYYNLNDASQDQVQSRYRANIDHKLFLSLRTNVFAEYYKTKHNVYEESNLRVGGGLDYTKKTSFGRINLGYRYYRHYQDNLSQEVILPVFNEEHVLADGEIVLLNRPYVDLASVVVKDFTGSIIYQINLDYILIERNNYLEVQRVLGGQIADKQSVMIDYQVIQPASYNFSMNNHFFSAGILLFDRLVEIYYRGSIQNYPILTQTDFLTLNSYNQNLGGIRLDFGFARAGVEYDNYNSNIVPYEMLRYYIELNKTIGTKLLLNLNGSMRDYLVINYVEQQQYANISGRVAYNFRPRTTASLEVGYLAQRGVQRNLDLLTSRAEFNTVYRQIYLKVGLELFHRYQPMNRYLINGAYVQLSRKF